MMQVDERQIGLWATILSCIFAAAPATYPGYWQSIEGFVPIFNATHSNAIADIATMPDFWRGMGSATFLVTQPLVAIGLLPTTAVRITFILAIFMGTLGLYAWLLPKFGDRAAGLGASIYALFPPFLTTIYERGSLSDALVMGLFPVALMGAASYKRTRSVSGLGLLLISILWMWRTQAGMALFATVLLLLYIGVVEKDWRGALVALCSGALGLATWFLFGHLSAPATAPFTENFVQFYQLLLNRSQPIYSEGIEPFNVQPNGIHLGFAALGIGILMLWQWRFGSKRTPDEAADPFVPGINWLIGYGGIVSLVLTLISLEWSAPLWQISGAERLLTYPFQSLLLGAPFLAMLAASLLVVNRNFSYTPYWLVLIAISVLNGVPYLMPDFTQFIPGREPVAIIGSDYNTVLLEATLIEDFSQIMNEQRTAATLGGEAGSEISNPPEAILELTWQTLRPPTFDYNVFFQALIRDGEDFTVLTQIDTQPLDGARPATTWRAGEILTDRYRLDLSELPSGVEDTKLRYYFGYYDWREGGERQPLLLGYTQIVDDKLTFYGR